jgi:hypothetical protein
MIRYQDKTIKTQPNAVIPNKGATAHKSAMNWCQGCRRI